MAYLTYLLVPVIFGLALSQDCPTGYWGENCDKRCEIHCKFECDEDSGTCIGYCEYGYWGAYCNLLCPVNCWLSSCRKTDGYCYECKDNRYFKGSCNVSCSEKWPNCRTCASITDSCSSCYQGYWNTTCDNNCTTGCLECDKKNGTCLSCLPKFWGDNCSNPCPGDHCSHCRLSDGLCEKCDEGYWGKNCQNNCDLIGCQQSIYERITGGCAQCKPNYWGDYCNNSCEIENCKRYRYTNCSKLTGHTCAECANGKWGSFCKNNCSENCSGICNSSDGKCNSCVYGTWGSTCNETCYGEQCEYCNKQTGQCQKCSAGYWDTNCDRKCELEHCKNNYCEKDSGTCSTCETGYWGDKCNNSCEILDCVSLVECSKTIGPRCYYCMKGKWGERCDKECLDSCNAGCKLSSGECITDDNVAREDPTQVGDQSYATVVAISVGTSLLVGLMLLSVVYCGRVVLMKRLQHRKLPVDVTSTTNDNVCTTGDTENSSQSQVDCLTLNELEACPKAVSASGSKDDNGDYETCVECAPSAYDELSVEPPYEN